MPLTRRNAPRGRYGQPRLDPSRPLYVRRRISLGGGKGRTPGEVYDPTGVHPTRLALLYRGGFISHDQPRRNPVQDAVAAALARAKSTPDPTPAAPVVVPPAAIAAPEPTKPKRARAGA